MVASLFRYVYNRVRISITYMNLDMIIFKSLKKKNVLFFLTPEWYYRVKSTLSFGHFVRPIYFHFFFYLRPTCNPQKPLEMLKKSSTVCFDKCKVAKIKDLRQPKICRNLFFFGKIEKVEIIWNNYFKYVFPL